MSREVLLYPHSASLPGHPLAGMSWYKYHSAGFDSLAIRAYGARCLLAANHFLHDCQSLFLLIIGSIFFFFIKKSEVYAVFRKSTHFIQNVSNEEWDNAIFNLNTRIISGDMPDILDMSNLSVQIYQSKGLLEDLYPYMEHDPEIRKEDYFENVFEAISLDGKLPYLTDGCICLCAAGW